MFIKIANLNVLNNLDKSLVQAKKIEYKDQKFGQLTLVTESVETDSNAKKVINKIEELLLSNYYKNDKMLLSEQINSLKIEAFFESSLVKTNRDLIDYLNKEKIKLNLKNINLTVCLVYEGEIFLSNSGSNKSFLLRKVKGELEMSDINPDENSENETEEDLKIFSSIINGEIPSNSYIIIATQSLSQYLLNKEMVDILDRLSLESAKEHIRSALKKINKHSNFAGIIIKNSTNEEASDSALNLRGIAQSEKETQEILEKTGNIDKKKIRKSIISFLSKINIFKYIHRNIEKKMKENTKPKQAPVVEIARSGSKTKKFAVIIILLSVVLVTKLLIQKNNEKNEKNAERIVLTEQEIKSKQGQIDTLLLYNNKSEAIIKIQELEKEIQELSEKERNAMSDLPEIEKELRRQGNSIKKIVEIENPEELTRLDASDSSSLSISNNSLYLSDKNGNIYLIDTEEKISKVLESSTKIKSSKILSKKKGDIIYFLNSSHLIAISNNEVKYKEVNIDIDKILDFDIYSERLYVASSNQIYKYNRGDKYESSEEWLSDAIGGKIVSIDIDYDIEITLNNGVIGKYRTGKNLNNDLVLESIEPEIDNYKLSKTISKHLYILDANKIIKFDKSTGELIAQYHFPGLDNIKDFTTEDNILYILDENTIYKEEMIMP